MKHLSFVGIIPLLLFSVWGEARAQGTIAGRVADAATGQPLNSSQVFIPTLNLGVLTGADGRFALELVPAGTHTVRIERLGYQVSEQEVAVASGETVQVNFALAQQALALDALVVTGTPGGTQRRAIGNIVSTVSGEDLAARPVVTMEQALQGRVPGVAVNTGSGMVGADGGAVRIRGSSSMGLANDPIIFVDGRRIHTERSFEQGTTGSGSFSRMNDINPADIESIEIIKGPAAATLYGTEASNGVIQIITKRGAAGATRFDASVEIGANWIANPEEALPTIWGRTSTGELLSLNLYEKETERAGGTPLFQNGPMRRYSVSASGGTQLLQYFASVNHSDLEGFVDFNTDVRTSTRMNLTATVSETVSLDFSSSYLTGSTRHPGNIWAEFRRGTPNTAADIGGSTPNLRRGFGVRPLEFWRDGRTDILDVERSSWGTQVNWNPLSWVATRAQFGRDVSEEVRNQTVFREPDAPRGAYAAQGFGEKQIDLIRSVNHTLDLSASVTRQLTDAVGSVTSAGLQYYGRDNRTILARGEEFATPSLSTVGATGPRTAGEAQWQNNTLGVFFQQQFDWNQRRFLTAAVRFDDNSAFGSEFTGAVYPKVSATWVLHEESFWNIDWLDQLRLRGAWGQAGQQPDVFAAVRLFNAQAGVGDISFLRPFQFGNPDLGPENGQELELGFDASTLNDRIGLEFTWFTKKTKDAIVSRPVAPSVGFPGFEFVNVGQVSNWGMEVSLDMRLLARTDVAWDLGVSLGTTHSRIDDMGGLDAIAIRRTRSHVEGYPLASQFERKVLSAEWTSGPGGTVTNVMCDGGTGQDGLRMGGPAVPCSEAPKVWWGRQSDPTWSAQVFPTLTLFQNWRLSALIHGQGGNMVGNDGLFSAEIAWRNTFKANTLDDLLYVAQRSVAPPALGYYNGGFAKLREVGLSYTLPTAWAERFRLSGGSVNVAARNVALLWQEQKFSYLAEGRVPDPELGSIPTEEFHGEPTSGSMPPASHLSVTVRVSF